MFSAALEPDGILQAVDAEAAIARGRVTYLYVVATEAHPDVAQVMTRKNHTPLECDPDSQLSMFSHGSQVLQDNTVHYAGQSFALVLSETIEATTEGACLLKPQYALEEPHIG